MLSKLSYVERIEVNQSVTISLFLRHTAFNSKFPAQAAHCMVEMHCRETSLLENVSGSQLEKDKTFKSLLPQKFVLIILLAEKEHYSFLEFVD